MAPLPANPVQVACQSVMQRDLRGLHTAVLLMVNASGSLPCLDLDAELVGSSFRRHVSNAHHGGLGGWTAGNWGVTAWNYQA